MNTQSPPSCMDQHPIFIPNGYQIYTKPVERLANFMLERIQEDLHGGIAQGSGGIGKSSAMQYLTDHAHAWLKSDDGSPLGVAARLIMPSGTRRSDGPFYKALGKSLRLTASDTGSCSRSKDLLLNFIRYRCGQAHVRLMVLFIDNAQRMTRQEMDYLVDIDDIIHDERLRLFLLFMRQSDEAGVEIDASAIDYPSHITRRWTMGGSHRYTCLQGLPDTEHALSRYRTSAFWPNEETSFCRYFARKADEADWHIERHAPLMLDVVNQVRRDAGLPASDEWPMQTFTGTVRYLLCSVAAKDPAFEGFTEMHVRQALDACGYLTLEYVRAGLLPGVAV